MASKRTAMVAGGLALASAALMAFLGVWEGEGEYTVYADSLAGGLPTVCKGITPYTSSRPVVVGETWTAAECEAEEQRVVEQTQHALARCIEQPVPQHVFDALTSHAHNLGWPATCGSRAVRLINAGRLDAGCRALAWHPDGRPAWSYAGGRFYQGLHNRRLAEMAMCLGGQ
ncbi:lysozyme [Alloalcanivorax sp. C16-1]|uniref:lysozyme n=1 Tax=Alloalcanivorax sp. C16-1 TaxID=3390051 RepID=UPI0039706AE2